MNINKYQTFHDETDSNIYWFNSEGPKGTIRKAVQFQETDFSDVYNLSLGDDEGDKINFSKITDNKDSKKVLASITDIVEHYSTRFPYRWILIIGDDDARARLYQMHLSNNMKEIRRAGYIVLGLNPGQAPEAFMPNKRYDGFLVKREE